MENSRLKLAYDKAIELLLAQREPGGWWVGQLSASALSTATAISTLSFYLETTFPSTAIRKQIEFQIEAGISWLAKQQNEDGGWGDTELSYSNISTSMLVIAAIHASGRDGAFKNRLSKAWNYVDSRGGVDGIRKRYGKDKTFAVPILANCAMAGLVEWKEVSALPFEAACVPQRFYNLMQLPVVSYAIPALVGIGIVKFEMDPPWDPVRKTIRRLSIKRSLKVLQRMQPETGGYLEAVPLTSFVSMALIKSGRGDQLVVENGVRFILDSFRNETLPGDAKREESNGSESSTANIAHGSWPIDTNLATWVTTLSINALAGAPEEFDRDLESWQPCLEWLLSCQNTSVHPFTAAEPGGWGWSDLSGAVPDADDTPGALIALKHLTTLVEFDDKTKQRIRTAAGNGVRWLVNLQNRDKGWPTFCRGWGKLPFDRSGSDITAHAIRALLAWKDDFDSARIEKAIKKGFAYLKQNQETNGSWLPLWFGNQDTTDDVNPCYGTAKVLAAYRDSKRFDTREAGIGLRWAFDNQNEDGGWGGGRSIAEAQRTTPCIASKMMQPGLELNPDSICNEHTDEQQIEVTSSVEETALVVEILLDYVKTNTSFQSDSATETSDLKSRAASAAERGIEWLVQATETGRIENSWPIGFYFAKLWYYERLYPLVFTAAALGKAVGLNSGRNLTDRQKIDDDKKTDAEKAEVYEPAENITATTEG